MVNVNKKYLDKGLKDKSWTILAKKAKSIKSPADLEKILSRWLMPQEITMLEKRLAIGFLLQNGVRHNEIKRILDVSSHTITSVKKRLNNKENN